MEKQNLSHEEVLAALDAMGVYCSHLFLICHVNLADYHRVELLLQAGLNPNDYLLGSEGYQHYPIEKAIKRKSPKMIELLLAYGLDVNKKLHNNSTALILATQANEKELVKFLLEKGADKYATDALGFTALHYAKLNRNRKMVKMLEGWGEKGRL